MATEKEESLEMIGKILFEMLTLTYEQNMGFVLLTFPFGEAGVADYIGNATREDMIRFLRETADTLEAHEDIPVTKGVMQ